MKDRLFKTLQRVHYFAKPLYWMATLALICTVAMPIIFPALDTLVWFSGLAFTAFLYSSGAIIDIAHHHKQPRSGLSGWFVQIWNLIMFWSWVIATGFLLLFLIKIIGYVSTH